MLVRTICGTVSAARPIKTICCKLVVIPPSFAKWRAAGIEIKIARTV
jgi:hypothetical protein